MKEKHAFVKDVETIIGQYMGTTKEQDKDETKDKNKSRGSFRKIAAKLFGEDSFFAHSSFMNELIREFEKIKNNSKLTPKDLAWFYENFLNPCGSYNNPTFNDKENHKLSAQIYRELKASFKQHFPNFSVEYEAYKEKLNKEPVSNLDRFGDPITYKKFPDTVEQLDKHGNFVGNVPVEKPVQEQRIIGYEKEGLGYEPIFASVEEQRGRVIGYGKGPYYDEIYEEDTKSNKL